MGIWRICLKSSYTSRLSALFAIPGTSMCRCSAITAANNSTSSRLSPKLTRDCAGHSYGELQLAGSGRVCGNDPKSLWVGPDRWLLLSRSQTANAIIDFCDSAFSKRVHIAVDYSSALKTFRVSGDLARHVLASGTGIDLRTDSFAVGSSCRTRFAQIAAIIVAVSSGIFGLFVDQSFEEYLVKWLA